MDKFKFGTAALFLMTITLFGCNFQGSDAAKPDLQDKVSTGRPWYFAVIRGFAYAAPFTQNSDFKPGSSEGFDLGAMFGVYTPKEKFWWKTPQNRREACEVAANLEGLGQDTLYLFSASSNLPLASAKRTLSNYFDLGTLDTFPANSKRLSDISNGYGILSNAIQISISNNDKNYYASGICIDYYRVSAMPELSTAVTISDSGNSNDIETEKSWLLNMDEVTNGMSLQNEWVSIPEDYQVPNKWKKSQEN